MSASAVRRARAMLGTLVDVGVADTARSGAIATIERAFDAIAHIEASMSRFLPRSEIARFNGAGAGARIFCTDATLEVLRAAQTLARETDHAFDITVGTGPQAWGIDGCCLVKFESACMLDLGGIAKGFAVDRAVAALRSAGALAGWVNAGGDLRCFGEIDVPVVLRSRDGCRAWRVLRNVALATSGTGEAGAPCRSVLAPECCWADALTKVAHLPAARRDAIYARRGATLIEHSMVEHNMERAA